MKNLLRKLNAMSTQSEDNNLEGSTNSSSKGKKIISSYLRSSSAHQSQSKSSYSEQNKPFSTLAGWFHSVTNRKSLSLSSPSSNAKKGEGVGKMERAESSSSGGAMDSALDGPRCGGGGDGGSQASNTKDRGGGDVDEEYQIQLAMELSAKEDPEAVQIEAVKQISLGSHPPESAPAEVVAYRYWNYNCLSYDDKILDGFYDLYGVCSEFPSSKMPSLIDLQGTAISEGMSWEVVLVNKAADSNLVKLEQRALVLAVKAKSESLLPVNIEFVQQLAVLVATYMGGPVGDPESMLRAWKSLSYSLKSTLGSMVLPLGSLTIGLARHRALLFKVLADSVNVPCQLVKGHQYTGSDEVAMNIVKLDDGREFIVDLMSDPGALIPYDVVGTHVEYEDSLSSPSLLSRDVDSSTVGTSSSGAISSCEELSGSDFLDRRNRWLKRQPLGGIDSRDVSEPLVSISSLRLGTGIEEPKVGALSHGIYPKLERLPGPDISAKPSYAFSHARSPSWTEGVSSPAVRKMKAKDVSQYMMDAAKENPHLAQKLHDVLLESGVVAPPNLFTGVYSTHSETVTDSNQQAAEHKDKVGRDGDKSVTSEAHREPTSPFLPPLPPKPTAFLQLEYPKCAESSMAPSTSGMGELSKLSPPPQLDPPHMKFGKNVPVAAAAAAAAAVVASSVVAAVAKSTADSTIANPVAAAATATAAAVVATTAAVGKQLDHFEASHSPGRRSYGDGGSGGHGSQGGSDHRRESDLGMSLEGERTSDRSVGTDSGRSEAQLEDVADCEIPWEEITLGERIGLGSYGEVYKGDWHGTEVAIKRFLDQDMWGESLEEFKSEVRIMKRLRHPNVVLFMGAITRPPNLSIITEFLPRGSLYRLLHRPNNQLDERRRLRMAYDAARGMNYLHNSSPVIVHRDLKSPNLLVDRNWVVKVCDFGLSKIKHSTFLSSRSTAGTAEWMAPEVLRNEPSNEKCDVYSYGVILWELCTMQQPWGGMNPMQVVGAVGFQHRRLDIPSDVDPVIADIIRKCWETDPRLRPSFAEIMTALKPFQKPVTASHLSRPSLRSSERDAQ